MGTTIIVPRMARKMNPGAFGTPLLCPVCRGSSWKYINKIGMYRIRY